MLVAQTLLWSLPGQTAPTGSTEIRKAKQEFIHTLDSVLDGYLADISPTPIGYTAEVREAREEFFRVFNQAVDGMIVAVFDSDEEVVREKKEQFLETFALAVDDLFSTVDGFYSPHQISPKSTLQIGNKNSPSDKIYAYDLLEIKL